MNASPPRDEVRRSRSSSERDREIAGRILPVRLVDYGWVAMDPADVGKVLRLETPEWLKDPKHPVAAPVNSALFGGWEGNWMAYNVAHDVALPGSRGPRVGCFMYPQGETRGERIDSLDPDSFKYRITVREVTA